MLLVSFPRHLTPGPSSLSLIILFIFQRTREFVLEHFTFFELRRLRFLHLVSCIVVIIIRIEGKDITVFVLEAR